MESKSECLTDDSPSGPGSALALAFDLGLVDPLVPFDSLDFFLRDFFAGSGMPGLAESDGSCCCWWRLAFTLPSDESLEWFLLCFTFVGSLFLVKFVKKRGAGAADASPEGKRMRSASPAPEQQLAITAAATFDVRPPTASPPSRKRPDAVIDLSGGGEGSSGSPVRLGGLSLTEGAGQIVKWLEQESAKQEEEKSQYAEKLMAAKVKLGKANTEVKALKADLAAQRSRAAEDAEELVRLRAELKAAKGGLRAAQDGQGEVLRAYTKRLLLSDQFTELARDLAGLINGNAALEAIEEVAKDYPGLDASKYGYQRLEGAAVYTQYAEVVRRHLGRLPLLNELVSSPALLTAEMVASCSTDRDAELDAAFDALSGEDVEMKEAGAGAEEERAEQEPSSSRGADSLKVAEIGGIGEGVSAGEQPMPEKEVGDS